MTYATRIRQAILAFLGIVCLVAGSVGVPAHAAPPPNAPNPAAVAEALARTRPEANAAWWGFDAADATDAIQGAIDSGVGRVVVPFMGEPWIIRPVRMRGDLELVFEPGVVVLAKEGEFLGGGDCLFRADDASHITVRGYGAVLRMRKRDYQQEPYTRAEWRMTLSFNGCTDVLVEGVRLESSGGDGIYIGATGRQYFCKDVVIRDVVCYDHHRQGISVIGAENLLLENCAFANTWGTAPGAGLDLEPDSPHERLVNVVVRECVFENNEGHEILVYPKNLNSDGPPVSIRFEDCLMRKTTLDGVAQGIGRDADSHGWAGICVGAVGDDGPEGTIEFINCTVDCTGKESVKVFDKSPDRARVRFVNCNFKDSWQVHHPSYWGLRVPVYFEIRRPHIASSFGGVEFDGCHVYDTLGRPSVLLGRRNEELGVREVVGDIVVHGPPEPSMDLGPNTTGIGLRLLSPTGDVEEDEQRPDADAE